MTRPLTRWALVALGLTLAAAPAPAQVKYPPRPATLDLQIRYRIRADRDERVRQFRVLDAHLKQLGFVHAFREDADLEILDPAAEYFRGTIPAANVFKVLNDPRVRTILFAPAGYAYPDAIDKPVPIRVGIPTGFLPRDQQQLHNQTVAQLARLGFREAVGYDHRGYTIVRGDIPYGNLNRLLKDLRREPSGWFMADTPPEQLPAPIRDLLPVRWVEVLADADLNPASPPALPSNRLRMTPDLRAVMDDMANQNRPLRVELLMSTPVDESAAEVLRARLRSGFLAVVEDPVTKLRVTEHPTVEGVIGNVVTVRFLRPIDLDRFMFEPGVLAARLPREAIETQAPIPADALPNRTTLQQALTVTRVDELHRRGYRGNGVRVVVVGSDFTGAAELIGKGLPATTRILDLTAELSPAILPAPPFPNRTGTGTITAQAVHAAAPGADLTLVRVDPSAFFQMLTVARLVRGQPGYSDALQSRITELAFASDDHRGRYRDAVEEYRQAFANLSDEPRPRERRENARKALEALQVEEKELIARINRSTAFQRDLRALAGTHVVVNTLVWESGYPLDGLSELSTAIDLGFAGDAVAPMGVPRSATRPPVRKPMWVQAASGSGGSVWGGMFRDADGNGVMEFATPTAELPPGTWTRELNFLASRAPDGKIVPELPKGGRVRLVVQWREPRDPNVPEQITPMFALRLVILQQLDPQGTKRASDELAEVARSGQDPYLVRRAPTYLVFEQEVAWTVEAEGRYAVRVESPPPTNPLLPALAGGVEIYPRFHVEQLGAKPEDPRVVFSTFLDPVVGVGIPGDAGSAITIGGTAEPQGRIVRGTAGGGLVTGGTGIPLRCKPDFLAADDIAVGSASVRGPAVAAGFAGGVAACLVQTGASVSDVFGIAGIETGRAIVLPREFFNYLPARP